MSDDLVRILEGNTFVVCDRRGDIEASPSDPTGLFSFDTRFLSRWVLTVDGQRLTALSIDDLQYFESRFFLVVGTGTVYVDAELSVIRQRAVGDGFSEHLGVVMNHGNEPVELDLRVDAGSDFADLFEVKDALTKKGTCHHRVEDGRLVLEYPRDTFHRMTWISSTQPSTMDERGLSFTVHLEPHGEWTTDLHVVTAVADCLRGASPLAVLRLRGRHAAVRRAPRGVRALDGRHPSRPRPGARGPSGAALDRRVRRPPGQRLRGLSAPLPGDGSGEPVLEGLLGLAVVPRRHVAGLPAGHP